MIFLRCMTDRMLSHLTISSLELALVTCLKQRALRLKYRVKLPSPRFLVTNDVVEQRIIVWDRITPVEYWYGSEDDRYRPHST